MDCHECARTGTERIAVAICRFCSVAPVQGPPRRGVPQPDDPAVRLRPPSRATLPAGHRAVARIARSADPSSRLT